MRDREVELSTVRIGDLGRPDSLTAVVVVLKVEDLAVARLSFSGGDRLQCRSSLLISSLVGHEEFGAAAGLAAAIWPSCMADCPLSGPSRPQSVRNPAIAAQSLTAKTIATARPRRLGED